MNHSNWRHAGLLKRILVACTAIVGTLAVLIGLLIADQTLRSPCSDDDYIYSHGYQIHKRSCLFSAYKAFYHLRGMRGHWANVVEWAPWEPAFTLGVTPGSVIVKWGDWEWDPDADYEHGTRAMYKTVDDSLYDNTTIVWIDKTGVHEAKIDAGGLGVCLRERVLSDKELKGALQWRKRVHGD